MSSTVYGNTTLNGIKIDDMIDDNRDIIYNVSGDFEFFARLVYARDNIEDIPKPAIAAFHKDKAFYAIFAKVLPDGFEAYQDGWNTTDLFNIELEKFKEEFREFSESEKSFKEKNDYDII